MDVVTIDDFLETVKKSRNDFFKGSFERAYDCFFELGLNDKDSEYFEKNASLIVEQMRERCWEDFLIEEGDFTAKMLESLVITEAVKGMGPEKAISWYLEAYPRHIYSLCLSNTQSRRSRAGKEFEDIIELILLGANIPMDSQGNIGRECFVSKGLGKLVDAVSPGVIQFVENKRNTVLISAKTTLRERWQEVPEEMGRTGASEMFLATLDEKISNEVLMTLYEANIQVTTTRAIKDKCYADNSRVLTFEQLISICKENFRKWDGYVYGIEQLQQAIDIIDKQIDKHKDHEYIQHALTERRILYYLMLDE